MHDWAVCLNIGALIHCGYPFCGLYVLEIAVFILTGGLAFWNLKAHLCVFWFREMYANATNVGLLVGTVCSLRAPLVSCDKSVYPAERD